VYICIVSIYSTHNFSIHVWGDDHPPPHCHVRFKDGSNVSVTIPFIEPMYGATISLEVREAIEDNLDAIADRWDALHPIRKPKEPKKKKLKSK
jgi:hypothetical protein